MHVDARRGQKFTYELSRHDLHERRYRPLTLSESSSSYLDPTIVHILGVYDGCMMMSRSESRRKVVTAGVGGLN